MCWAGPEDQAKHECFVLAPEYGSVVVDDNYQPSTLFDTTSVPLNTAAPLPNPAIGLIDLTNFRYTFTAGAGPATGTPVTLVAFQFTYTQ